MPCVQSSNGCIRRRFARRSLPPIMAAAHCRDCPNRYSWTGPTSSPTRMNSSGEPVVPNGIRLSKIHHAAFDTHLIGIDPDYRVHVSEGLLGQNDGRMLEGLKR